jgi:hypothetical protein
MTRLQIYSDEKDRVVSVIQTAIASEIRRLELGLEKTNRQIESGKRDCSVKLLRALSQTLEVDIELLLSPRDLQSPGQEAPEGCGEGA